MSWLALKVDVDTYRGTLIGVPRLVELFERLGVRATFLFTLGPDHTGRALKRVFRRGFIGKVRRTSVVQHYGLKTLLYGTVLPGPHIAHRCEAVLKDVARREFEVGVHAYDHVKWQDSVHNANLQWTQHELNLARDQFVDLFGQYPQVHGAAGWQINRFVPGLESLLGFRFASDVRGECPFIPVAADGQILGVPQLPTTLPTLDELIGRPDLNGTPPTDHLQNLTAAAPDKHHVFTLHAELEGGAYLGAFEQLLRGWKNQGRQFGSLTDYYETLDFQRLPRYPVVSAELPGRSGLLACQGPSEDVRVEDDPPAENSSLERMTALKAERYVEMITEMKRLQALHDPFRMSFGREDSHDR